MTDRSRPEWLTAELTRLAAEVTGFGPESIRPRAIERAVAVLEAAGWARERIARGAIDREPEVVRAIREMVVVGETWFFRQPEQFAFLAAAVVPRWLEAGVREIRAWSAGCATGAEAYSLAAMLLHATAGHDVAVRVLGTDLLDRNVATALAARYRRQELRASTPPPFPVLRPVEGDVLEVLPGVRAVTRFQQHSLLDARPPGDATFHLVMCRHVLVYFTPDAAERACAGLTAALEPDGALVLGTMDRLEAPRGLEPVGPAELQTFRPGRRPPAASGVHGKPAAASRRSPPDPVALHVACLRLIEAGDDADAARHLDDLCASAPDYLPARVERALLCARSGDRRRAAALMREVALQTEARDPRELLAGPEALPVGFYRDAALSFLAGRRARESR